MVTEFEFALHEVGPMVHFGLLFWSLDQGAEVLRLARERHRRRCPDDVNVMVGGSTRRRRRSSPSEHHLAARLRR